MNPISSLPSVVLTEQEQEEVPSPSVVAQLKQQLPGRELHRVEMRSATGASFVFVMTGQNRFEWKKYQDEILKATGDREKQNQAIENAALAMIRWPVRAEVQAIFDANPGLVVNFPEQFNRLCGLEVEVTTKKL